MFQFVETPFFSRVREQYLPDEEFSALEVFLWHHPEAGDVIPGSGGVRKLRWAGAGKGTRGGLRVIYYLRRSEHELWFLTLYAKSIQEDIPASVLRRIKEEIDRG